MIGALQQSLEWIYVHPHWALLLLFAVALLDSVFIIGAFVPAGIALFAAGALVALGSLELWQAVLLAAAGAIIGDSFSFWLGRRYGERLFAGRLLQRYPEAIANGRRFFVRYGAYSVALARFLGPMRAMVPALAGASGLGLTGFVVADVLSATLWAFAFVLPGVAFGASLGLAAEVAGRLALLLLALLASVAVVIWLTAAVSRATQRHAEDWIGALLDWSRRHRRLGKFGAALADPAQPETPVLVLLAAVLLGFSALWLWLWSGSALHAYPSALDAAVFQSMRDLHSPWGLALAQRLLQLGQWPVYGPLALVTFACLLGLRQVRAAAHWVAALAFGAALSAGLYAVPTLPPPQQFFGAPETLRPLAPDLTLSVVLYTFLPVLLSTGRTAPFRRLVYGSWVTVITLMVLARLYVGAQWFSAALFSVVVGLVWAALLGLGYRRHGAERLTARRVLPPVVAAFAAAVALAWSAPPPEPEPSLDLRGIVTAGQWRTDAWRTLPRQRVDIAGRDKQPLTLQWAGDLDAIRASLEADGWTAPPPLSAQSVLRWLTGTAPVGALPILPQVHAGHHPVLNLRRVRDDSAAELLRLWPSDLRLVDGRPVWLGSIIRVEAQTRYRLLRYPVMTGPLPAPPRLLGKLPGVALQRRDNTWLVSFDDAASAAPASSSP